MRQHSSLKSFATLCVIFGAYAASYNLKSAGRAPWEDAAGIAGGMVLATGLVLLIVSMVISARRRRREALATRRGFEVLPPREGAA